MTAPTITPLDDIELEAVLDDDAVCSHHDHVHLGHAPATHIAVHIACGDGAPLCRTHLDRSLRWLAGGKPLFCDGCHARPLTRADFSIRPI